MDLACERKPLAGKAEFAFVRCLRKLLGYREW